MVACEQLQSGVISSEDGGAVLSNSAVAIGDVVTVEVDSAIPVCVQLFGECACVDDG